VWDFWLILIADPPQQIRPPQLLDSPRQTIWAWSWGPDRTDRASGFCGLGPTPLAPADRKILAVAEFLQASACRTASKVPENARPQFAGRSMRVGAVAAPRPGAGGRGSSGQAPAWRRWRITTTFSSVGLLRRSSCSGNPPGETALDRAFARGRSSQQHRAIAKAVCHVNDRATAQQAVQAATGAAPRKAPAGLRRPAPVSAQPGCPGSRGAPAAQGRLRWQRLASTRSGVATIDRGTPSPPGGEHVPRKSRRGHGFHSSGWFIEQQNKGLGSSNQGRSRGPLLLHATRRAGGPGRSAKGSRPTASEQGPGRSRQ